VSDPYLISGTDVLRNLLGITDRALLQEKEVERSTLRLYELQQQGLPRNYDLEDLQAVHRFIFQDVYDWAGKLRTTHLSKQEYEDGGRVSQFAPPNQLAKRGNVVLARIGKPMDFRNRCTQDMADHLGGIYNCLNTLHPFREGNGRALRVFMSFFAKNAGRFLSFEGISKERWVRASVDAHHGDNASLLRIFSEALDTEAHRRFQAIKPTFDKMRNDDIFDWHQCYVSVPPPGTTIEGIVAITTDEVLAIRTEEGRLELVRPDSTGHTYAFKEHVVITEPERMPDGQGERS
jgi:cell filamentation protein